MNAGWLVERVEAVAVALPPEAKTQALRVVELARELESLTPDSALARGEAFAAWRRELGSLVELLSRRGSQAIGVATLGRALLAELAGDAGAARQALRECDEKLSALGL